MIIVADRHIPFLLPRLQDFGEVRLLEPEEITPTAVKDADALIIRTRTKCTDTLLSGSKVRFIGTATIGYDHIDTEYCRLNKIVWTNAPGCNADGVCQYVVSAIRFFEKSRYPNYKDNTVHTIGVVGVGHVGKLVAQYYKHLGFNVLVNDPLVERDRGQKYLSRYGSVCLLEQIARQADVITFHTPLTLSGEYPTFHLLDESLLSLTKTDTLIVNAARGGVVDERALLKSGRPFVLDCWENEPEISEEVLQKSVLGTYHIAGYTKQGKQNATDMILYALRQFSETGQVDLSLIEKQIATNSADYNDFDLQSISEQLKCSPKDFENLRKSYVLR